VSILPAETLICPQSGSSKCATNQATIQLSQPAFGGTFGESDDCPSNVAVVTPIDANGPSATFNVAGQSTTGQCRAIFTGGNGAQVGLAIIITSSGVHINTGH
jgi:hypothetical protein